MITTTTSFTFAERLARAKIALREADPFLFFLAIQFPSRVVRNPEEKVKVKIKDDKGNEVEQEIQLTHPIATAATDFASYIYNEDFCHPLNEQALRFVVAHETCHVAFAHNLRTENRHPGLANVAMDYVINLMLNDALGKGAPAGKQILAIPMIKDPKGRQVPVGMFDKKYKGMIFEEVYELLKKDLKDKCQKLKFGQAHGGKGGKAGNDGGDFLDDIFDDEGNVRSDVPDEILDAVRTLDKNSGRELTAEERQKVMSAVGKALHQTREWRERKGRGSEPSDFERLAEDGFKPHSNWHEELRAVLMGKGIQDITWARPNKRFLGLPFGDQQGFYMPSRLGVSFGSVACVVDTSGSISEEMLSQFCSELNNLLRMAGDIKLYLFDCDAGVHLHGIYRPHEKVEPNFKGGGGTSFVPAFEEILRIHRRDPITTIIYLTDLDGAFPEFEVPIKTVWLVPFTCADKVPFGKIIPIPVETRE